MIGCTRFHFRVTQSFDIDKVWNFLPTAEDCQGLCLNGGFCDRGICECPEGFEGEYCEFSCKLNIVNLGVIRGYIAVPN